MSARPWLKPLKRWRVWVALWWLAIVTVIAACLLPGSDLPEVPVDDKLSHALAFFALAASAVQLFRRGRPLLVVALALLALGIAIELAQFLFTATRAMEAADVLADLVGIVAGIGTAWTPLRDVLLRLDRPL